MTKAERNRAAVAAWRATAPANDSDIFRYPRKSSPRHSELSADLAALLQWRALSRPAPETLKTNWNVIPANDNKPEVDSYDGFEGDAPDPPRIECVHQIRPTPEEIDRAVKKVKCREVRGQLEAVSGDIEKRDGLVVRLGRLEFGTLPTKNKGSKTEPGNNRQLIRYGGRWVVDKFGHAKGPDIDEDEEQQKRERLADWLGCEPGQNKVATPEMRKAARERAARCRDLPNPPLPSTSMSLNEARAFAGLPPVDVDERPALPTATSDIGDIFESWMCRPKNTKSGAVPQEEERLDRETVAAQLAPADVAILDAAMKARNFREIGCMNGSEGKTAERHGKAELVAATARLATIFEKIAA